jgi:YggT family protein
VQIVYFGVMLGLTGLIAVAPETLLAVAWIACIAVLRMTVYLLMGVVIIVAVLSWVSPYSPLASFFDALSRPLLLPVRRRLPPLGGIDLSPLVVVLLLQVVLIVLGNLQPAQLLLP